MGVSLGDGEVLSNLNHASGSHGAERAKECMRRGAEATRKEASHVDVA